MRNRGYETIYDKPDKIPEVVEFCDLSHICSKVGVFRARFASYLRACLSHKSMKVAVKARALCKNPGNLFG